MNTLHSTTNPNNRLNNILINNASLCGSQCKFCDIFDINPIIISSSTQRCYTRKSPNNSKLNCKSSNCIYILTCCTCSLQYVGETSQIIRNRFNLHRSHIKNNKLGACNKLNSHFNTGLCKGSKYTVQILEKLPDNTNKDMSVDRLRKEKEKEWMLKLRTVFPFGLNSRIGDECPNSLNMEPIALKFPPTSLNRAYSKRCRRPFNKNNSIASFLSLLKKYFSFKLKRSNEFYQKFFVFLF